MRAEDEWWEGHAKTNVYKTEESYVLGKINFSFNRIGERVTLTGIGLEEG